MEEEDMVMFGCHRPTHLPLLQQTLDQLPGQAQPHLHSAAHPFEGCFELLCGIRGELLGGKLGYTGAQDGQQVWEAGGLPRCHQFLNQVLLQLWGGKRMKRTQCGHYMVIKTLCWVAGPEQQPPQPQPQPL